MGGFTYIVTNKRYGVLYIGVTSNILRRIWEHKGEQTDGFTKKYKCDKLVWYEEYPRIEDAIVREKQLKKWERMWKVDLIEKMNPSWDDLYDKLSQ